MPFPQDRLQSSHRDGAGSTVAIDQPPPKRPRTRGSAACDACRTRRSRCDLVDRTGCHRCKQLRTQCSFGVAGGGAQVAPTESGPGAATTTSVTLAPPSADLSALLQKIEQLEQELIRIREVSRTRVSDESGTPLQPFDYGGLTKSSPATTNITTPSVVGLPTRQSQGRDVSLLSSPSRTKNASESNRRVEKDRDDTWYRRWADPETYSSIHRGIHSKEELGLRDPILEGIIPEAHAEVAYQMFKYHFAAIHPNPKLLVVRSPLPSQPFLLSAALYYTTRCAGHVSFFTPAQIQHLEAYLFANLNAYHRGCRPSLEGIMAAFILSFLPPGTPHESAAHESSGQADVDPARMIGLAYAQTRELGQSIFIERLLQSLEKGIPVRFLEQPINDARLFMSVINRSAWFSHSRCPWATAPVLVEDSQRRLLITLQHLGVECELDKHLALEHSCLQILHEHSRIWQGIQQNISPGVSDVTAGNDLVRSAQCALDALLLRLDSYTELKSQPYLRCHVVYCKWWVAVRNLWSIYRLALPLLVDAMYDAWVPATTIASEASCEMLSACIKESWKLGSLPHAMGNAIVLCYAAISMGIMHFRHFYPDQQLPPSLDIPGTLVDIEMVLSASGNELSGLLLRTKDKLDEYRSQLTPREVASDTQAGGDHAALERDGGLQMMNMLMGDGAAMPSSDVNDLFAGLDNWWAWPTQNEDLSWTATI